MAVIGFGSLVIVAFVAFNVQYVSAESRLINGTVAKAGQFPYQVSLRGLNKIHFCAGALLSNNWIVTVARCMRGDFSNPSQVLITVGARKSWNDGRMYPVQEIRNHPQFNLERSLHDISMVRSVESIQYVDGIVQPVPTPVTDDITESGIGIRSVVVSGWGATTAEKPGQPTYLSEKLRYQVVSIILRPNCRRHLGRVYGQLVHETTLCTQNKAEKGICPGDNGNPLVTKENPTLVGIASWGVGCGRAYPDVYTRIFPYTNWIRSNLIQ